MPAPHMGPVALPGVHMPTWLLRFDKHGASISPQTRAMLLQQLSAAPPGDIVFFSHGWNNDFDDASDLYARFLREYETLAAQHPIPRPGGAAHAPLFIGVLWPSIWLSFDNGPQIAAGGNAGQAGGNAGGSGLDAPSEAPADALVKELADALVAAGAAGSLERVYALLEMPQLDDAQARELAGLLVPAFGTLADDEAAGGARPTASADLLQMLRAMQQAQGGGAAPAARDIDDWGVPAGAGPGTTGTTGATAATDVQTAGFLSKLDPRQALRLFSVYKMKDRAGTVGAHGVATLLRDVMAATAAAGTPVHAVGHSYGCKVMLSAVCAPAPLPRPLQSLLLLQPAVSHLCFADDIPRIGKPGGYVGALAADRVRAPVLCTYSRQDFALHTTFHLALRRDSDLGDQDIGIAGGDAADTSAGKPPSNFAALGGYGPRRAGSQRLVDPMPAAGAAYPPLDGMAARLIGLDGSAGLIGSHGDVASPAAAWALHRLVAR